MSPVNSPVRFTSLVFSGSISDVGPTVCFSSKAPETLTSTTITCLRKLPFSPRVSATNTLRSSTPTPRHHLLRHHHRTCLLPTPNRLRHVHAFSSTSLHHQSFVSLLAHQAPPPHGSVSIHPRHRSVKLPRGSISLASFRHGRDSLLCHGSCSSSHHHRNINNNMTSRSLLSLVLLSITSISDRRRYPTTTVLSLTRRLSHLLSLSPMHHLSLSHPWRHTSSSSSFSHVVRETCLVLSF